MPSPDSIHDQPASSVVESGRTEKSKLPHVGGNPQRSDAAGPNYNIVPVPFGLSVRFRTALVLTPVSPIYDADGRIVGASKIARDITARKEAERVQDLLIGELNHRVKNVLATVAAIARQTFAGVSDIEPARTAFDARLQSLARAHDLLTRGRWEAASLRAAVTEALSPYPPEQFEISGPDVDVSSKAVVALTLILHELATNAAKYGALAVSSGKVTVSWNVSATEPLLTLLWKETGGPQVEPPTRKGFGSRLIETLSSGHLRGQVDLNYDVLGVHCMIAAPLDTEWSDHDHVH